MTFLPAGAADRRNERRVGGGESKTYYKDYEKTEVRGSETDRMRTLALS